MSVTPSSGLCKAGSFTLQWTVADTSKPPAGQVRPRYTRVRAAEDYEFRTRTRPILSGSISRR